MGITARRQVAMGASRGLTAGPISGGEGCRPIRVGWASGQVLGSVAIATEQPYGDSKTSPTREDKRQNGDSESQSHPSIPQIARPMTNPALPTGTHSSLDSEEQDLLSSYEAGTLQSVATPALLDQLRDSARTTTLKDQRINIRLSSADLDALRERAMQLGMPYQTLISSVLHRYVSGEFTDTQVMGSR